MPKTSADDSGENLDNLIDESKRTLDHQLNWIQQIDNKAVRILRANILLLGLILTALSLSTRTEILNISQFINLFSIFGLLSLVASSMGAGITYISSSFEAGIGSNDIGDIIDSNYKKSEFERKLARSYSNWIEYNQYVLGFNAVLITVTIIGVIDSITYLVGGVIVGVYDLGFSIIAIGAFIIVSIVLMLINYGIYKSEDFVIWYFRTRENQSN